MRRLGLLSTARRPRPGTLCRPARLWAAALLAVLAAPAHAAGEAPSAVSLLMQMSKAARQLDYAGTFVYLRQGSIDSMKLLHKAGRKGSRERLYTLSGREREVVRDGEELRCIFPDQRRLVVDNNPSGGLLPTRIGEVADSLVAYYDISVAGSDRVAQRPAWRLAITPRGPYRYGYRLWLDKASKLLLRSEVVDQKGNRVEQILFTELEVPAQLEERQLSSQIDTSGFERVPVHRPAGGGAAAPEGWEVTWLPEGFRRLEPTVQALAGPPLAGARRSYSDGLAGVSVFIELAPQDETLHGFTATGAMNAFSTRVEDHQITAVGDLPPPAVRRIATSVRPRSQPQ